MLGALAGLIGLGLLLDAWLPDDGRVGPRRRRHAWRAESRVVQVRDQLPDDLEEVVAVVLELSEATFETT